ncbi:MAG: divergent PAP2 family protein [Clostridia bacterium]|nr:divergent PAP2 family protein [Clostridia bacterium]
MNLDFWRILWNPVLVPALFGWFVAQSLKIVFTLIFEKRLDFKQFFASGGMPSSHSAFVSALAVSCALQRGWESAEFGIAFVFAFVVMFDAAGVRRETGNQALLLNKILDGLEKNGYLDTSTGKVRELLGHTPVEVLSGCLLGIVIGICYTAIRFL